MAAAVGTVGRCAEFTRDRFSVLSQSMPRIFNSLDPTVSATIIVEVRCVHGRRERCLRLSVEFRDTEESWCSPGTPLLSSLLGSPLAVRIVGK